MSDMSTQRDISREKFMKGQAVVYKLRAWESADLASIVGRVGADPRALRYLQPKRRVLHLFAPDVDFRAAAFIKQELLSRGGDAAVGKHVIDGRAERSDVLMMGTDSQVASLLQKMKAMDCWGLTELREALAAAVRGEGIHQWTLPLPGGRLMTLNADTEIMGILNVTPDSFHEPSRVEDEAELLRRAEAMLEAGAEVLDLGAESTRPGASPLSEEEERARLIPALRALRRAFPQAVISVDTYKGAVALAAAEEGADIINDVGGFEMDGAMLDCAARTGLPYVLTHINVGRHMEKSPAAVGGAPELKSENFMAELLLYFNEKLKLAEEAGLSRDRVIVDPGLGFGKGTRENLLILKELEALNSLGRPILIGHSRKRFIGETTGEAEDRLCGTVAVSALLEGRAQLLRVHDVDANHRALLMARAIRGAQPLSQRGAQPLFQHGGQPC